MLTSQQEQVWNDYQAMESRGTRDAKIQALESFVTLVTQSPINEWESWARAIAERVVDGNEDIPLRVPLFRAVVFPALLNGHHNQLPGCARWLAGLWRNPDPDSDGYYLSVEIVPAPSTRMHSHIVHDNLDMDSVEDWNDWIEVLTKYVPNFSTDVVRSVLDLPDDEHSVDILVREFPDQDEDEEKVSAEDAALHDWLDLQYHSNLAAFRQPNLANSNQQLFTCIYNLLGEIQNGGFQQYFGNSIGDELAEVRHALRKIGAWPALTQLESACRLFPRGNPGKAQETRIRQLDKMSERKRMALDALDNEFVDRVEDTIAKLKSFLEEA